MRSFARKTWWLCLIFIAAVLSFNLYFLLTDRSALVSPIFGSKKIKIADNVWFPNDINFPNARANDVPDITAGAAFFVETNSGEVMYEKNAHQRAHIASLTKIMTAILTLENKDWQDTVKVSQRAADMEPDKMFLNPGETFTVEELMQGLFLVSANDAAEVFAEEAVGRREEFINLMNSKAEQIGMNDTKFINPTGLEEDGKNYYSSAYDVALMSRYAIRNFPKLLEFTSQPHIYLPATKTHKDYDLFSGINLVSSYPGVYGFKTGYTPEAGLTLVTVARRKDKEIVGVLLNSTQRREDAKALLDYSFAKLGLSDAY